MKIDLRNHKILFLGYGGVAKCVLSYFHDYFTFSYNNIYIVDKCSSAFYGPHLNKIKKKNKIVLDVTIFNFDKLIDEIKLKEKDIIIDLTVLTSTYYFIQKCFEYGFHYINTSIEDHDDILHGTSIDIQQKTVHKLYFHYIQKYKKPKSNILTEFGQNPGLIQHYILFALNHMNKLYHNTHADNYDINALKKVIDLYKIGTIFLSEIDNIIKKMDRDIPEKDLKIYNTWSVAGLIGEGMDYTELTCGKSNKYVKPVIKKSLIDTQKMEFIDKLNPTYDVIFLNKMGLNTYMNSICPVLNDTDDIVFKKFEGRMIHHGEIFELAKLFGNKTPFLSYVYKINKYAEQTVHKFLKNNKNGDENNLTYLLLNKCDSFHVLDNINKAEHDKLVGHDSIGCTFFCGDSKIEKIYWCGGILSDTDKNVNQLFTPTIIQVAAGLLSGLSYILEPVNKNRGLLDPCDLDTNYILSKSIHLLGKFFFTEIPVDEFDKKFKLTVKD